MKERADQSTQHWAPILQGEKQSRALDAIRHIGADLVRERIRPGISGEIKIDPSVGRGYAGYALFFHYAGSYLDCDHVDLVSTCLQQAMAAVEDELSDPSLYMGFAGVSWVIAHLARRGVKAAQEVDLEGIDEFLHDYVTTYPSYRPYDLIGGVVGLAIYFAERPVTPGIESSMNAILEILESRLVVKNEGFTVYTPPHLLAPEMQEIFPEGWYNLGLSHGIPGVIGALSTIGTHLKSRAVKEIMEGLFSWIWAQRIHIEGREAFPHGVGVDGSPQRVSRLAWCYGDLGVAAVLLRAGRIAGHSAWEAAGMEVAESTLATPEDESKVWDAGLCHGSGGLGHIYNRLYQATSKTHYRRAAIHWIEKTLEMRNSEEGVGGYRFHSMYEGKVRWIPEYGFLEGGCGVGLSLLSASTGLEPSWDRLMLLDIPNKRNTD